MLPVLAIAGLGWLGSAPPPASAGVHAASEITAGTGQACELQAGKAYCWGAGGSGQLGDGQTTTSAVPVAVTTSGVLAGKTLTQISAGFYHTCALDSAGHAYCWGQNYAGGLGDGTTTDSAVPVAVTTSGVLAGKTLTQISGGFYQICALDSAGHAYCWGAGAFGGLGNGKTGSSTVPVAVDTSGVLAGRTLTQINSGSATCALDSAGAAYCWGYNAAGGLGDGTTADSAVPVAVDTSGVLAGQSLTMISVGNLSTCAIDEAGNGYCWGAGGVGQLGDGTVTSSTVPVAVVSLLPQPPGSITARARDHAVIVSWAAPVSLGTGTLAGYTATARPGRHSCSTRHATRCIITGLRNGTAYTVTVVTRASTGRSAPGTPVTVIPHRQRDRDGDQMR
jgi:alpha-tubulin suppressor-like RCC1 family protein